MLSNRKIIHIDMDAFYASIEQRDNPDYKGKPVAVGSDSDRGVISAASYEARKFGVRSAMSSVRAKKLCPDLIFAKMRRDVYLDVSKQVMKIFKDVTDLVEPLSIDEAFLDVTNNKLGLTDPVEVANNIRNRIYEETSLTASAGISFNKFLAKKASDINKPNGYFNIPEDDAVEFINELPVEQFFGIGAVTAKKMHSLGIHYGKDLRGMSIDDMIRLFGKQGVFFYEICRGRDNRPVNAFRERKSLGAEYTFEKDLTTKFQVIAELYKIELELMERMSDKGLSGRTITLKIKYSDFTSFTRSKTLDHSVRDFNELHKYVKLLLQSEEYLIKPIRLMGVSISNFSHPDNSEPVQLLFEF